ncbi:MAG: metal ABC transporter permease [Solirubrobacteraceae bacterium]|nr:MAG: metal ABC transporter permease [Solirubrobacterales bacterium]
MFTHEFMRNALLAGSVIALACGLAGYVAVLRGQVFAGDALSHVAFTGALAAAAAGIDTRIGLFIATIAVGTVIGTLGRRAAADDVVIGNVFAWVLGIGLLFLAIFSTSTSGGSGIEAARTLFGSIFGLSAFDARLAATIGLGCVVAMLSIARPLLFASLDPDVAAAQGVPTRLLGIAFASLLGVVAAEAVQAVGALLLLGLLATPAAAARLMTRRPFAGLALAGGLAVVAVWGGLATSYEVSSLPPSSAIIAVAVAIYTTALAGSWVRGRATLRPCARAVRWRR